MGKFVKNLILSIIALILLIGIIVVIVAMNKKSLFDEKDQIPIEEVKEVIPNENRIALQPTETDVQEYLVDRKKKSKVDIANTKIGLTENKLNEITHSLVNALNTSNITKPLMNSNLNFKNAKFLFDEESGITSDTRDLFSGEYYLYKSNRNSIFLCFPIAGTESGYIYELKNDKSLFKPKVITYGIFKINGSLVVDRIERKGEVENE